MSGSVKRLGQSGPVRKLVELWRSHPQIAQFITYFLVGNLATLVQVVLIPVLQPVFGATGLVDVNLHLFGPIGDPTAAFLQCCIAFWVFFPIMKIIFPESKSQS